MDTNPYQPPDVAFGQPPSKRVSRLPDAVSFACGSCGWKPWIGQLYRRYGVCRRCQGKSWTVTASYTDREVSVGLLALLTRGRYFAFDEFTNRVTVTDVSADDVLTLIEEPRLLRQRVSDFLNQREQQRLRERGAVACKACGVLFVPLESKAWNEQGYCSKGCAADDDLVAFHASDETSVVQQRLTVRVRCTAGHEFQQLASFSGCMRACPECGQKCRVP